MLSKLLSGSDNHRVPRLANSGRGFLPQEMRSTILHVYEPVGDVSCIQERPNPTGPGRCDRYTRQSK